VMRTFIGRHNMPRFIDLSHAIKNAMPAHPGFPRPIVGTYFDHNQSRTHYDFKAEFYVNRFDIIGSLGTYIDSPFHRHRAAADLSKLPIESMAGLDSIVIDPQIRGDRSVDFDFDAGALKDKALLLRTGWDKKWGVSSYYDAGPFIEGAMADRLIEAGVRLVGVDFANVDNTQDPSRPAHTKLLQAGVLIVENLTNLGALPQSGLRFYAVAPKIENGASFPVRAFAEVAG